MQYRSMAAITYISLTAACGNVTNGAQTSTAGTAQNALEDNCDLNGTWGIKFEIPVRWPATMAIEGGQGMLSQWVKATRKHDGNTFVDTISLCGMTIPDNQARPQFNNELYGITFPDALFDSAKLPTAQATSHLEGAGAQAHFSTEPLAVLLGLKLENPVEAVWPARGKDIVQEDADEDGAPGLTVLATTGDRYTPPPINFFRSKRAAKFHIVVRSVVQSATGQFTSCDAAHGSVTIPVIAGKAAINSHIVGCERTDGAPCVQAEHEFIDKLQSGFDLEGTAAIKMARTAPDATCATVRSLTY